MYVGVLDSKQLKLQKATSDVAAVRQAFPSITDESIIVAMAAWFALLCNVDDEIEQLGGGAARDALRDSMHMLQDSTDDSYGRRPSLCDPISWRVHAFTKAIVRQTRPVLAPQTYAGLIDNILTVFAALDLERAMKDEPSLVDPDVYLRVRCRTVGLDPFFYLVRTELAVEEPLARLEAAVSLAVGLQNDIVGLRKDIMEGERFNFILLRGEGIERGLRKAVGCHNRSVRLAAQAMDELPGAKEDHVLVLGFVARHWAWAKCADRYTMSFLSLRK